MKCNIFLINYLFGRWLTVTSFSSNCWTAEQEPSSSVVHIVFLWKIKHCALITNRGHINTENITCCIFTILQSYPLKIDVEWYYFIQAHNYLISGASSRRAKKKSRPRSAPGGRRSTSELLLVPPSTTSWLRETWSLKCAKLRENRLSSEYLRMLIKDVFPY